MGSKFPRCCSLRAPLRANACSGNFRRRWACTRSPPKAAWHPKHYPQVGEAFFNPEGIVSSSPGLRGTSYPGLSNENWSSTPTGLCLARTPGMGRNPVGVDAIFSVVPRVARPSQPWAGGRGRNPFGIQGAQDVGHGKVAVASRRTPKHPAGSKGLRNFSGSFGGRRDAEPLFGLFQSQPASGVLSSISLLMRAGKSGSSRRCSADMAQPISSFNSFVPRFGTSCWMTSKLMGYN